MTNGWVWQGNWWAQTKPYTDFEKWEMSAIQTKQIHNIQNHHNVKSFENILENICFTLPSLDQTPHVVLRGGNFQNDCILPFSELLGLDGIILAFCMFLHHPFTLSASSRENIKNLINVWHSKRQSWFSLWEIHVLP